jgi:integrating conjugative element protein (TIGR03757 family)
MTTKTNTHRLSLRLTLILAFGPATQAQTVDAMTPTSIDIFTTTNQPISKVHAFVNQLPDIEVQIHKLDGIKRFEVYLSAGLPGDTGNAKDIALKRLGQVSKATRHQLEHSATALAAALQYGVQQYPAIVFDGEFVVYGVTDLSIALAHYRQWQQGQTP